MVHGGGAFRPLFHTLQASQVTLVVNNPPANSGDIRDADLIPGLGGSLGEGNSTPLQNSCLENSMDRGPWLATVHRAAKRQTRLSTRTHTHTHAHTLGPPTPARWPWAGDGFSDSPCLRGRGCGASSWLSPRSIAQQADALTPAVSGISSLEKWPLHTSARKTSKAHVPPRTSSWHWRARPQPGTVLWSPALGPLQVLPTPAPPCALAAILLSRCWERRACLALGDAAFPLSSLDSGLGILAKSWSALFKRVMS